MKRLISLAIILTTITISYASQSSKITNVVVYQQGAKITREAFIKLIPGTNEIVLSDLTTNIDQNSIQVKLAGSGIILSATSNLRTLENTEIPIRTKRLEDSIQSINKELIWLSSQKTVYQGEEKLIAANQNLRSEKEGVSVEEIIRLSEFYRKRLLDIHEKIFSIDIKSEQLQKEKSLLQVKLNQLRHSEKKIVGEVIVQVSSKTTQTQKIRFSYLTYQAGWTPSYDVRADDAKKPLDLMYKANVFQSTGKDWNNVKMTISTGNPMANNNRPIMNPWYIDFAHSWNYGAQVQYKKSAAMTQNMYQRTMAPEVLADEEMAFEAEIPYTVEQTLNRMSAEYTIDVKQKILSDGKNHIVPIQTYELNSSFTYHAIPKLDKGAYLIAKVADYGQFNLLPGPSNLFFEGMYIGQSYLNPVATVDSMLLSLGQDSKINIKRTKLKDFTEKQIVGGNVKETRGFEILVRNNNTFPIEIEVMDQLPISKQKDIEVKPLDIGSAELDKNYGSLLWKLALKPGETKIIKFSYQVKYPKDQAISSF